MLFVACLNNWHSATADGWAAWSSGLPPSTSPANGSSDPLFVQSGKTCDEVRDTSTRATTAGVGLQLGQDKSLRASLYAGWRLDEGGSEIHSQFTWKF